MVSIFVQTQLQKFRRFIGGRGWTSLTPSVGAPVGLAGTFALGGFSIWANQKLGSVKGHALQSVLGRDNYHTVIFLSQ